MSFAELGLSDCLLRAIEGEGYKTPTPVQEKAIPAILSRRDVMAAAQTGTGKTAAFTLPLLQNLAEGEHAKSNIVRALILTPTRELAAQIGERVATYGKHLSLRTAVVYGGVKINPQMKKLRGGVDVLVATPGRLLDLYNQRAIRLSSLEVLVLDEADRMLDLGFINDITRIMSLMPKRRQNLLFSATFSHDIRRLSGGILHDPIQIETSPRNAAARSVKQSVFEVDKAKKPALLSHLIRRGGWGQALVFTLTKRGADRLTTQLEDDGITAIAIHGDKSQGVRTRALAKFKAGEVRILVATDVASRGLDIEQLPYVVNFDLPKVATDYVHRIGRTGRAGLQGEAISLVTADDVKQLTAIETVIQQRITREQEVGFVPKQTVAITAPRAGGAKKPKKPKKLKDYSAGKSAAGRGKAGKKKTADGRGGKPSSNPVAGRGRGAGKTRKPAGRGR
ncbi:MAG: DEAD/DEAH box helicase [Gammaproteobacteria bacterium]|nr:DEAD/DEAH box helicase [Gammaproteobacteria bacterium]